MKIEGFFSRVKDGNDAVKKLKVMGFKAFVDINDHYVDDRNVQTNLPGTEESVSLSGLVLESDAVGAARDKSPLNAASPMVSGYGKFEEIADVNCKIVVEAGKKDSNKVKKAIQDAGGSLDSPNLNKPKFDNEMELSIYNTINENRKFIEKQE